MCVAKDLSTFGEVCFKRCLHAERSGQANERIEKARGRTATNSPDGILVIG